MRTVSAKLSDADFEKISMLAREQNLTISSLIKQAVFAAKIVDTKAVKKISQERNYFLNRIGNNLNQIAKKCNEKNQITLSTLHAIKEIEEELKKW